jgi:hypothetical protein
MADAASEKALTERNLAVDDCVTRADAAGLALLLNDDFEYTHSNGMHQNKAEYVAAAGARKDPPLRRLSDSINEFHDDIAVVRGSIDVIYDDGRPQLYLRYVRVWRLVAGQWKAISQRTVLATDRKPAA